jgi:vacuolar-type H+-ATPase subunit I/STV1
VRARIALVVVTVVGMSTSCGFGSVPGFCGVSDKARLAVADVDPSQYPAESAKHVQELKDSAAGLSGAQKSLALKVANDLAKASEAKAGSLQFTDLYNKFVKDSNRFDHKYCNQTEAPDF